MGRLPQTSGRKVPLIFTNGVAKNIREDIKDMINVVPIAVAYLSGLVGGFVVAAILFVGTR
jgi:hypothetical protein